MSPPLLAPVATACGLLLGLPAPPPLLLLLLLADGGKTLLDCGRVIAVFGLGSNGLGGTKGF